ncbi:hypothetical protein GYMLUDRAFT_141327, partial [Collybiopsis luxurians FD-317 M1]
MDHLFSLDVDDNIWLDIGLGYNKENNGLPPLWLSSNDICQGIHVLLDRDRCSEEQQQLLVERNAMQEWLSKEWRVV